MRASKYCDPISVYEAHLDGFGYEAGDLAGGAELDDLQHGGRRAPPAAAGGKLPARSAAAASSPYFQQNSPSSQGRLSLHADSA